jgi:hypothetical protein
MPARTLQLIDLVCDREGCPNKIAYIRENEQDVVKDNAWIKTVRTVQRVSDGAQFVYCSDECEVVSVGAGQHNPQTKSAIVTGNEAQIKQVAAQVAAQHEATKRIKAGN